MVQETDTVAVADTLGLPLPLPLRLGLPLLVLLPSGDTVADVLAVEEEDTLWLVVTLAEEVEVSELVVEPDELGLPVGTADWLPLAVLDADAEADGAELGVSNTVMVPLGKLVCDGDAVSVMAEGVALWLELLESEGLDDIVDVGLADDDSVMRLAVLLADLVTRAVTLLVDVGDKLPLTVRVKMDAVADVLGDARTVAVTVAVELDDAAADQVRPDAVADTVELVDSVGLTVDEAVRDRCPEEVELSVPDTDVV